MYSYKVLNHINDIEASIWDDFFDDNPFTKHAFIYACEASLSASEKTGWIAHHFLIYRDQISDCDYARLFKKPFLWGVCI